MKFPTIREKPVGLNKGEVVDRPEGYMEGPRQERAHVPLNLYRIWNKVGCL